MPRSVVRGRAVALAAEQAKLAVERLTNNFRHIAIGATLICPLAGLQRTGDVDVRAFLDVLLNDLAEIFIEHDDAVPVGFFLGLARRLVAPLLRRSEREIGDRPAVLRAPDFGIGAEMARQLARAEGEGMALVLAARSAQLLESVARECRALGAHALAVPTDVSVQDQCRRLVEAAVERFGGIDVLVNNAGRSAHALFEDVADLSLYEDLMRVNLWCAVCV